MGDPKIGAGLVGDEDAVIYEYVALGAESDTGPTGGTGPMGVDAVLGTDVVLVVLDVTVGAGTFGSMLSPLTWTFLAKLAPARGGKPL